MAILDFMPEGSVACQGDGMVYVSLDKIPQLQTLRSYCRIDTVEFDDNLNGIIVDSVFSENTGIDVDAGAVAPDIEDNWSENASLNDRQTGNTVRAIAREIFESDKVDEGIQTLKDKANELKDAHGDELRDAALSWLKKLRGKIDEPEESSEDKPE